MVSWNCYKKPSSFGSPKRLGWPRWWLDLVFPKVFPNLNDSVTLRASAESVDFRIVGPISASANTSSWWAECCNTQSLWKSGHLVLLLCHQNANCAQKWEFVELIQKVRQESCCILTLNFQQFIINVSCAPDGELQWTVIMAWICAVFWLEIRC